MVAGIKLDTLKDCLQFLQWLHDEKSMQDQVARELVKGKLPPAVFEFLGHVSTFYNKLCKTPTAGSYVNAKAKDVTDALLECVPKLLAALYFLLYNVDYRFDAVGGAKWEYNYPGWESTWFRHFWQQEYGGRLQGYLRASLSDKYGGLILGGFGPEEVTYGYDYNSRYGYQYGKDMTTDLRTILDNKLHNYFRDVFFTTVITTTAGTQPVNTANVLALVRTFCQIVDAETKRDQGKRLKAKLDTTLKGQNKCINWEHLKSHCSRLNSELEKLFKKEAFSYTGQARSVKELNTEKFAEETAKWFRQHLHEVQQNVKQINTNFPVDDTLYLTALRPFATKNIFPYGFIFGKGRYGTLGEAWKTLSDHWDSVIDMLGREDDGLDKLKRILDGEQCPPPPKPRPRPVPAPRPPRPARTPGGMTSGPRGGGGVLSRGSHGSGVRGGTVPNRMGGIQGRGGAQNRGRGAMRVRAQGPGAHGAKGVQRSRHTGHRASTEPQLLHRQSTSQSHPQQPSHSAPRVPIPLAEILPTPPHSVSQTSVRGPSSASSSRSSSPSVTNAGGTGLGPQAAASGHSQRSSQDSALNHDTTPGIPGQHSDSGGGRGAAVSPGGMDENSTGSVSTASKPAASLSVDLSQVQSAPRDVQSGGHNSDPGSPGPSLTQAGSSHDGPPVAVDTPIDQAPGPDSNLSPGIRPDVSSNVSDTQNSRIQAPDPLTPPDAAQDLKDQALSPTRQIAHQSSHVQSARQSVDSADSQSAAANRAGLGVGGGAGGGVSADGTDGDSQVVVHSGKSSNAPQPSVRLHTPALSAAGPPSDISGSPGDLGLTLPSPSKVNPQGHTDDTGGHNPASVLHAPGQTPLGNSDDVVTRAQQRVEPQDNGSLGQPAPALPAPPPTTAAEPSNSQNSMHGPVGAQGVHDKGAMQSPGPNLIGNTDPAGPLNQQVTSSSTVAHNAHGKSTNGSPDSTGGDVHGAQPTPPRAPVLAQSPSVSGSSSGSASGQGSGSQGGQDVGQPTGAGSDNTLSSGANTPGVPAPGGGGSAGGGGGSGIGHQGGTGVHATPQVTVKKDPPQHVLDNYRKQEEIKKKREKDLQNIMQNAEEEIWSAQKKSFAQDKKGLGQNPPKTPRNGKNLQAFNLSRDHPNHPPQPSHPPPGTPPHPTDGRRRLVKQYYELGEERTRQGATPITFADGKVIDDPFFEEEKKYREKVDRMSLNKQTVDEWNWDAKNEERRLASEKLNAERKEMLAYAKNTADQLKLLDELQTKAVTYSPPQPNYSGVAIVQSRIDDEQRKTDMPLDGFVFEPPDPVLPKALPMTPGRKTQPTNGPIGGRIVSPREKPIPLNNFPYPSPFYWEPFQQMAPEENTYDSKGNLKRKSDSFGVMIEKPPRKLDLRTPKDLPIPTEALPPATPSHDDVFKGHLDDSKIFDRADSQSKIDSHFNKFVKSSEILSNSLGDHVTNKPFEPLDFSFSPYEGLAKKGFTPTCRNPWYVAPASSTTTPPTRSPPPDSDRLPPPNTVREMLFWLVGLNESGYIGTIEKHVHSILKDTNKDLSHPHDALEVTRDPYNLDAARVANTLTEACLYSANVLHRIKHKDISTAVSMPDFTSEYSKLHYSSNPACLLCQLRDYVYACCHQLTFLKVQCSRDQLNGGWQDCKYGCDVSSPKSPLQAFLTDDPDSIFKTHLFDPRDICRKSRVNMGFRNEDLPEDNLQGKHISTVLSPTCGGEDPLLTLASYLNCITRRTPRTTGELVSFFHNFGNSLHLPSAKLSPLGSALSQPHPHCPDWDSLAADDLQVIKYVRGSAPLNANSNHNHDKDHPQTLSTLLGCGIDNANCPQHMKPITYRAYALYSSSFAHHYFSWTVYLPDRLWKSLLKLHYDLEKLQCHDSKSKPLHQCDKALPLLYSHGLTPPEGMPSSQLKCSDVISKLEQVVNGKPIAGLMTAMDTFLWHIRMPFLYTVFTLWLTATLYIAHSLLYRMDVLRIRSHLLTTRASHLIDVKALLAESRRMLSLYKDVDYFDDDFHS
ncbi:ribosome binding protein [Babesia ovata]|uniref:Ribosome binding protein n=1 Tax=Babesia ovata TaxID=189622 RepID=A0A2H6KGM4_9APIC|nr:ribosome binding protein [Babesia ovata]GBE62131.1 ribosome binding protein [Babesia ovata]